ncbi:MAG: TIGR00282 family metallophosphoesterase [Phycisphaerales bacterium]|nr:TIGR00282 family metallophosphoesterase [Phycisphaerales bacterium]
MGVRILCVGDVVGDPGRRALKAGLEQLVPQRGVDCVIVNAENTAGGSGITPMIYESLRKAGAHLITLGDHLYRRKEIIPVLETSDCAVRAANLPKTAPGREFAVYHTPNHHGVAVVSLLGRLFMKLPVDCPFRAADRVLASIPSDVRIVAVDMHAEATSEKVALGWHLDGRVSIVFGTHTHVPTADERILPKGTAYITDLGMTGPYDSVLGRRKDRVMSSMINGVPQTFDVAEGDVRMCGVLVDIEPSTGRAKSIERVCIPIR